MNSFKHFYGPKKGPPRSLSLVAWIRENPESYQFYDFYLKYDNLGSKMEILKFLGIKLSYTLDGST